MFEVGKKYGGRGDSSSTRWWDCLAVNGNSAWLRPNNMGDDAKEGIYPFHEFWLELPPEPKRWSTWQNVYGNFHSFSRGVGNEYRLQEAARLNVANRVKRIACLRRDFEQHEGKEAVCVHCELEKI